METFPEAVKEKFEEYKGLSLGGKEVPCPYNRNKSKVRAGLRVLVGKGNPEEIVEETLIYAKLKGVDLHELSISDIRKFMVSLGIGVDCSGFAVHLFDKWTRSAGKGKLWGNLFVTDLRKHPYRWLVAKLRPLENISVRTLARPQNSIEVRKLSDMKVGDMIISGPQDHVLIVSEIKREGESNQGRMTSFKYVQSTQWYDDQHGVREGEVVVKDENAGLREQDWKEVYKGKNWTYDRLMREYEKAQIRRLKVINKILKAKK